MNWAFIFVLLHFWITSSQQMTYFRRSADTEITNGYFWNKTQERDGKDQKDFKDQLFRKKNVYCKTVKIDSYTVLNCSHHNLTYIPRIGFKIDRLVFGYNNLKNVTSHTFENISFPEYLITLELDYDNIENISTEAVDIFTNLNSLQISGNPFKFDNLKMFLGAITKLRSLRTLTLNALQKFAVKKDLFSMMEGTTITSLSLRYNKMNSFSMEMFTIFSRLTKLNLSFNDIFYLRLWNLPSLQALYLSDNNLRKFPQFCTTTNKNESYFPSLRFLNIGQNEISKLTRSNLNCIAGLHNLSISSNYISVIPNNLLVNTTISDLNLNNQNVRKFKIERYAFRSNSLLNLYIGYNANVDDVFESLDTFEYCSYLLRLGISNIKMTSSTSEVVYTLFAPLKKLLYFNCYACEINQDPKFFLANKPNLITADMSGSLIQTLTSESFKQNLALKKLRLQFNKLVHLPASALPVKLLKQLEIIDLSNNPFTCDCNLQWFIDWLNVPENKKKISTHHWNYNCANPEKWMNKPLAEVTFSYRECHPWNLWIWVGIVVGPCLLVAAITGLVVYRNRWNIKHYIYLLRKKKQYHLIQGDNYQYDAFVGYEANDSVWVRRRLIPVLEAEEGLKLCIHERDFQAGVFINDNIVQNINASQKVILILTNAFAQSGWCMFELKVAHSKQIEEETEVLVILLEKIDARNINHSLKVLMDTTTYIEWTEDVAGQQLFWTKLKDAMKK
ncbi:toll-like receptor 4 [Mercenaria mercenaria]|uniref:toll-like receptor 4 n=1 Tax=Mercenaria mercenaria TaxID=6596 RepID=UPI00234F6BFA|nr:toll-like receptor 4 [Mercenaria mercenaria]XP_045199682.2 toll-like receptor 4 [Mercenaria mercenaria]XP_045199683.2 toll-like receptor 4 [Mercenaria mercenaria]